MLDVAPSVASLIKQSLGVPGTEKVDVFAADFATRNVAAYEAYVVGLQHFLQFDYASAQQLFRTAVDKAPDFAMAHYRLAHAMVALGDTAGAMEQIEAAQADAGRLSARERRYIAAGASYFARDYATAERQYRDIVEDIPYETEARVLLLYVLHDQGRYDEALEQAEVLASQDPGDEVAWSTVADVNIKLGRYDEAEQALQKFLQRRPTTRTRITASANGTSCRAVRGSRTGLPARATSSTRHSPMPRCASRAANCSRAALARARAAADRYGRAGLQCLAAVICAALDASHLLRAEGRCAEAEQLLGALAAEIVAERVSQAYVLSVRALCRLDAGDVAEAGRLADDALDEAPGADALPVRARARRDRGGQRQRRGHDRATVHSSRRRRGRRHRGADATTSTGCDARGRSAAGALRRCRLRPTARRAIRAHGVRRPRARGDRRSSRRAYAPAQTARADPPAELMRSLEPAVARPSGCSRPSAGERPRRCRGRSVKSVADVSLPATATCSLRRRLDRPRPRRAGDVGAHRAVAVEVERDHVGERLAAALETGDLAQPDRLLVEITS